MTTSGDITAYRISGHEKFPCRYPWLPKAVRGVSENQNLFSNHNEDEAMVLLGLGKNMVRSVRFWAQAADVITTAQKGTGHTLTAFGQRVLGDDGYDPYLEDIRTLWLLHWNLSTNVENPLLAWNYLLNHWHKPEIIRSEVLNFLKVEAERHNQRVSPLSLESHFDTFLHTYVPTRERKDKFREDSLDCPLIELELMVKVGEREWDRASARLEPIFAFRREEKPEITSELFVYSLNDFWMKHHKAEDTIPLREVAHGHGSPGQIFKLPEENVRERIEGLSQTSAGLFTYIESANLQQIRRNGKMDRSELLKEVYFAEEIYA